MTGDLLNVYGDYIPLLNSCDLQKRPKVDLGNMLGEDGNVNNILMNFSNSMSEQGYIEESKYWGNEIFLFNYKRLESLKMRFDTAMKFILAMGNTNLEMMMLAEQGEKFEPYKTNPNIFDENGLNCFGRSKVFYAKKNPGAGKESLQDMIDEHGFEILLEKDKLGMTPFDHWLLSGKSKAYVVGLQNLVINGTEEEIKSVMDNKVFDYSVQDSMAPKFGITIAFYYTLLKSTNDNKDSMISNYVDYVSKKVSQAESELNNSKMSQVLMNVIENIEDFRYLAKGNLHFKTVIEKTDDILNKRLIDAHTKKNPVFKSMLEKRYLNKVLATEDVQSIKPSRKRL